MVLKGGHTEVHHDINGESIVKEFAMTSKYEYCTLHHIGQSMSKEKGQDNLMVIFKSHIGPLSHYNGELLRLVST